MEEFNHSRFGLKEEMPVVSSSGVGSSRNSGSGGEERCPQCRNVYGFYKNEEKVVDNCGHARCWLCVYFSRVRCPLCPPVGASTPAQTPGLAGAPATPQEPVSAGVSPSQSPTSASPQPPVIAPPVEAVPTARRNPPRHAAVAVNPATEAVGAVGNRVARSPSMRPIQCPMCPKTLSRAGNLKRHCETVHQQNKPFVCNRCGAEFGQKAHLENHVKSHIKKNRRRSRSGKQASHSKRNVV